jgi:hypothetical protein
MTPRPGLPAVPPTGLPSHTRVHDPRVDLLLVYAVHNALRRDLRSLADWSRTCVPVPTPGWLDLRRYLTRYLDADAAVLWALLRTKRLLGPDTEHTAAELARERRRVVLLAATVDECLSGRGPGSRTAEHAAQLEAALTAYLDHEHLVLLPAVARFITTSEWAEFDAAMRRPFGLATGVALCDWLVADLPPDQREPIRRLFPPAVRLAHKWRRHQPTHHTTWNNPAAPTDRRRTADSPR